MSTDAIVFPLLFLLFFSVLGFWIYTRFRRSQGLIQARMELQTRVLERFDSPSEFTAFLDTEGGRRFLAGLTDERGWRPARRILSAVQWGLVLACVGTGFLVLRWTTAEPNLTTFAVIFLTLGVGFLVSAAASYVLSRRWGLMTDDDGDDLRRLASDTDG